MVAGGQPGYWSVFLRNTLTIDTAADMPRDLVVRMYVDDGAILWINGQEVERWYVPDVELPFNSAATNHSAAWEEILIANPGQYLNIGKNTIAIQVFNTTLTSSDLSFDVELFDPGTIGLAGQPTPGAQNSVYTPNAPPQIRQVDHAVDTPAAGQTNTITAKVTDPNGVGSVQLHYQIVLPGNYIPRAQLPFSWCIAANEVVLAYTQDEVDRRIPRSRIRRIGQPSRWSTMARAETPSPATALIP